MKKTPFIALFILALAVSSCNTNDDGFYNSVYVNTTSMVNIDPHASAYDVGEKLYVNASIPRLITETGQSNPLDVYETSGATQFSFSYVIEKKIDSTTWDVIYVNDNQLDIINGSAQNGFFVYGICNYNATSQTYEYRVGFPLLSSGTYRLSFGYNSEATSIVELRSESPATRLVVNINSDITNLDSGGYYNFTVN